MAKCNSVEDENIKNVYWKEECDLCMKHGTCGYEPTMRDYKDRLEAVPSTLCYGTLRFNCDYFQCDTKKYHEKYPAEVAG